MAKESKKTRFAMFTRVSMSEQERGESLPIQKAQLEQDVRELDGVTAAYYGDQAEHGTEGYDHPEFERLLADASKNLWDAIIVYDPSRWSRENERSKAGIKILRQHNIRFFVRKHEYNLNRSMDRLFLGMTTEFNEFTAHIQTEKALESKIKRAKAGIPVGKLPWGRLYNRKTGTWEIDPDKQEIIQDAAHRYLDGESREDIASEYGMDASNLLRILTKRCGPTWEQKFAGQEEPFIVEVPALLDEKTIKAILERASSNRTYTRGQAKHRYLLAKMIFCRYCGQALYGQTATTDGVLYHYYRHAAGSRTKCTNPVGLVNAPTIEGVVFQDLIECFGNAPTVKKAIEDAFPHNSDVQRLRKSRKTAKESLERAERAMEKTLRLMAKEVLTEEAAEKELGILHRTQLTLRKRLEVIDRQIGHLPTSQQIDEASKAAVRAFKTYGRMLFKVHDINEQEMTWEEKRLLAQMVFSGTAEEKRMGVYVGWGDEQLGTKHKVWSYQIHGHLINLTGRTDGVLWTDQVLKGRLQRALLKYVTSGMLSWGHPPCYKVPFLLTGGVVIHRRTRAPPSRAPPGDVATPPTSKRSKQPSNTKHF